MKKKKSKNSHLERGIMTNLSNFRLNIDFKILLAFFLFYSKTFSVKNIYNQPFFQLSNQAGNYNIKHNLVYTNITSYTIQMCIQYRYLNPKKS